MIEERQQSLFEKVLKKHLYFLFQHVLHSSLLRPFSRRVALTVPLSPSKFNVPVITATQRQHSFFFSPLLTQQED